MGDVDANLVVVAHDSRGQCVSAARILLVGHQQNCLHYIYTITLVAAL